MQVEQGEFSSGRGPSRKQGGEASKGPAAVDTVAQSIGKGREWAGLQLRRALHVRVFYIFGGKTLDWDCSQNHSFIAIKLKTKHSQNQNS